MSKGLLVVSLSFLFVNTTLGQRRDSLKVLFTGYFDFYYASDFQNSSGLTRLPFLVSYNRNNLPGLNLAMFGTEIRKGRWRLKTNLQAGSFVEDNYVLEAERKFRFLQEGYAEVTLDKKQNVSLSAGVFPSHIGYESAIGIDNINLSRSLASELTPYFLSGAKISFKGDKLQFSGLVLNSWSRIYTIKSGQFPALGTQLVYQLRENTSFYWNTMLQSETQNASRDLRFYNNFFLIWTTNHANQFIFSLDYGLQKTSAILWHSKNWYTSSIVYSRKLSPKWNLGGRVEYFRDKSEVVTNAVDGISLHLTGISSNLDYKCAENMLLRFEGRLFYSPEPYFKTTTKVLRNNATVMVTVCKKF